MEYEKIQIAIVADPSDATQVRMRLCEFGVSAKRIRCIAPMDWSQLTEDPAALCFWATSAKSNAHQHWPNLTQLPTLFGQSLNIFIEAAHGFLHSPYALSWEELASPKAEPKLRHLIEEAQVRDNLRQHQQWYSMAVGEGNVGLWWWDREIDFVHLSKHFQKMLGIEPDQLPQNVNQWLTRVHADDRFKLIDTIERQFNESPGRFEIECRIRQADGLFRWYGLAGQYQRGGASRKRVLGVAVDINERKEAVATLASANKLANSALHAKTEFLTNMSHNLRTPLTAILGHADLLGSLTADQKATESLESISRNSHQLMHLLDDILELSCIESAYATADMGKTSLDAILSDTEAIYRDKATQQGLNFHLRVSPGMPPEFVTDAARIRQLLTRLLDNALKFTPEGEITVEASYLQFPKTILQIVVRDTGIGIPASRLKTIFDPFDLADNSPSRSHGGSGLGLSICQRLVNILQGTLDVESEVGNGTSFLLRIPLEVTSHWTRTESPSAGAKPTEQNIRLDGYRVLLVEDGRDNQLVLSAFLRKAGATVAVANNGLEAVEWVSANRRDIGGTGYDRDPRVDLILMDMQMPVMDGYQATHILRESGFSKPILAVTAHALQGDRQRCLKAGCDDYFTKPVKRGPFLDFVRRYAKQAQHLATTLVEV